MAEARSIRVALSAQVSGYIASMRAAGKATADVGRAGLAMAGNNQQALTDLGNTAGKIGLIAAAGVGIAVKRYADFDKQMSATQAATGATGAELEQLRGLALKLGADSQFSAGEASAGITNLAKAGVASADILAGALKGSLDLAAAGELSVADAAEYTATALTQFQLAGSDATHVADLLAAGAGKAQGEVSDMALALGYAGVPAANLGVSIEQTAGSIALLASNGIIGEKAGTSLRGMLSSLAAPSQIAQKTMDDLGISVFDAQGKFLGLDGMAGQLQQQLSGLTQEQRAEALGRIFGNAQLSAANVLYREGAAGVREWTRKVNDSGFASEQAATKTDNLMGDIERLGGALDSLLIGSAQGADSPLRGLVKNLTGVVDVLGSLDPALKSTGFSLLALTAVLGGGVWATTRVLTGVAAFRESIAAIGPTSTRSAGALRALALAGAGLAALGAAGTAMQILDRATDESLPGVEALTKQLLQLQAAGTGARLGSEFDSLAGSLDRLDAGGLQSVADDVYRLADSGGLIGPLVKGLQVFGASGGASAGVAAKGLREASAEVAALDAALSNIVSSGSPEQARQAFEALATAQGLDSGQQQQLLGFLPQYQEALAGAGNAAKLGADATNSATGATKKNTGAVESNSVALAANTDAMRKQRSERLAAANSQIAYQAAIDDATAAARQNGRTLDITTEKGRNNRTALLNMAAAWNQQSDAAKNTAGAHKAAIGAFVRTAVQMGMNADRARAYAQRLLEIPPRRVTDIVANTGGALASIAAVKRGIESLQDKRISITTTYYRRGYQTLGGLQARSDGGIIHGPGTSTSDSIPIAASDGEYVMRAAAVSRYGVAVMDRINSGVEALGDIGARRQPVQGRRTTPPAATVVQRVQAAAVTAAGGGGQSGGQSLRGLRIEGTVNVNGLEGHLRGVVRSEIDGAARHDQILERR